MHPDAYMPFYFRDFWEAVKGQPDFVKVGYLQALTYYWGHTHCKGIENKSSENLRKICEVDKDDWEEATAFIFDNDKCFCLDTSSERWHQKRAQEVWDETKAKYEAQVKNGRKGGLKKAANKRNKHE